jgi:hypothetical protein
MFTYRYDSKTLEFAAEEKAYIDPERTKAAGYEVYILPAYSTFKRPDLAEHQAAIYDISNDDWVILPDYRGQYIVNESMGVKIQTELGPLPDGYISIPEEQAVIIQEDPIYYIVDNGRLIKNPNYEEEKAKQEAEIIAKLSITKYDFYKLICQPAGLGYQQVMALVNSNDDIAAAWNFCERVYRGDELLNRYIKQFIPNITDAQLDEIFKTYGK